MRHTRSRPLLTVLLLLFLACTALGCRTEEEKAADAFEAKVMATLDNTPDHLRVEVLRTCDKWRRTDESQACTEAEARRDQFECWLERGYPKLEHGYKYKLRQRTRDSTTLLKLDHCLELRGWRLIKSRRENYEHIFGQGPAKPPAGAAGKPQER